MIHLRHTRNLGKGGAGGLVVLAGFFVDAVSGIGKAISSSYTRGKILEKGLSSMESQLGNRSTERGRLDRVFSIGPVAPRPTCMSLPRRAFGREFPGNRSITYFQRVMYFIMSIFVLVAEPFPIGNNCDPLLERQSGFTNSVSSCMTTNPITSPRLTVVGDYHRNSEVQVRTGETRCQVFRHIY
jgi:hypothetical protein